jgi:hypothetical protein
MSGKARSATNNATLMPAGPLVPLYWDATREPLYCLVFLFPLVAAYELGALLLVPAGPEQHLVAPSLIRQLVAWLGTDAVWVPGVALLVTLLIWQFARRGSWRVRGRVPLLMVAESLVLTPPLFVLGELLQQTTGGASLPELRTRLVLALGAGVYEELVFRFYLVGGLMCLFARAARMPKRAATVTAIVLATLIFAACHFQPIGSEAFAWPLFLMLTAAGGYLSVVFVLRGLGIATGSHVAYNLISLILRTA